MYVIIGEIPKKERKMLTFKQQLEIAKEVKNSPKIKKRETLQACLWIALTVIMLVSFAVVLYGVMIMRLYNFESGGGIFLMIGGALFIVVFLLVKPCSGFAQKTDAMIDSAIQSKMAAAMGNTKPLSDEEKLAYKEARNKAVEEETSVMKKYFWWNVATKCSVVAVLAILAFLFLKGIALLGLLKCNLFEFLKDALKTNPEKDGISIFASFFAVKGSGVKDLTAKTVLRFASFVVFVGYILMTIMMFVCRLPYIFKGREINEKVRLQDRVTMNAKMIKMVKKDAFEMDNIIVYAVSSLLWKGVCLFTFPIMFFDYIKDGLFLTSAYMYIIPAVLLLIDVSLQVARLMFANKNKEIIEKILPLLEQDAMFWS